MTALANAHVARGSLPEMAVGSLLLMLAGCSVPKPNDDTGSSPSKVPGQPFGDNVCFLCSARNCGGSVRACVQEASCSSWLSCVSACPTDDSGVAADGECLRGCGLPVSAEVLFECVQDFANGVLLGCEQACAPP